MTGPDHYDLQRLQEEALDWVVRLKAGEPTNADIEALMAWRGQSPAHEEAFKTAARLMRNARLAAEELSHEKPDGVIDLTRGPSRHLTRRVMLGGAVAASVAGYAVINPPLGLWPSLKELSADYRTGKGEQRRVSLDPNVSVDLNTQTSVALSDSSDALKIDLISGEAAVSSKLSDKSLLLTAANGRILARSADFNALCMGSTVSVTCLDGSVRVECGDRSIALAKSQQTSYSPAGLQAPVAVNAIEVTAWQTGQLIFHDRPLEGVVEDVNRYRPGRIIITNAELKKQLVNGTFQLNKLGNFVAQVEQLFGTRAISLPGGIVLLG